MANKNIARIAVDIEFADGETRTVRPLTIKKLRKFVTVAEKLQKSTEDADRQLTDEDFDTMMEAASIVLGDSVAKEELENVLDVNIFWQMMAVAMGNRVSDPEE